jgi:hypothetical protein
VTWLLFTFDGRCLVSYSCIQNWKTTSVCSTTSISQIGKFSSVLARQQPPMVLREWIAQFLFNYLTLFWHRLCYFGWSCWHNPVILDGVADTTQFWTPARVRYSYIPLACNCIHTLTGSIIFSYGWKIQRAYTYKPLFQFQPPLIWVSERARIRNMWFCLQQLDLKRINSRFCAGLCLCTQFDS